ncbi:MAG: YbjN domain-containing protein [Rhodothermales bacterium]|nr:YbjN domain-containing protein [Rhodothermales bacterium]
MSSDLLTPENLSKDVLKSMYDAAYMETSFDDDGDLRVEEGGIRCFVMPSDDGDRIQLLSLFGADSNARREDLLEFANRVNAGIIIIRVSIRGNGGIAFDYDIPVRGGITKQAVVLATKRFLAIPIPAIRQYGSDLVQ